MEWEILRLGGRSKVTTSGLETISSLMEGMVDEIVILCPWSKDPEVEE